MTIANKNVNTDNLMLEKMAIFQTSLKLIRQGKFHATPMSEIALLSRISGTMIFYVYENRDELLAELGEKVLGQIHDTIAAACKKSLTFQDTVRNIWMGLYTYYTKHPDVISFIEQIENLNNLPGEKVVTHPANSAVLVNFFRNHAVKTETQSAETLAWSLHCNVLCAAKLQTEHPDEWLSLLTAGINKQVSNNSSHEKNNG
jgi:AcrR family transcriptional regulator